MSLSLSNRMGLLSQSTERAKVGWRKEEGKKEGERLNGAKTVIFYRIVNDKGVSTIWTFTCASSTAPLGWQSTEPRKEGAFEQLLAAS